ncbi:hypothetical protein BR93DRAFT_127018 [Coniochaeta sp. PMI_546]|nr:hypothetical protein BR93DRAFT_127018 [Coniochaeta sp. PMI_546]
MRASIVGAAFLAATVSAHGNITSPPARLTGPGMVKACGQSAVDNVLADGTIPLEDVFNALPSCKLDLCRGAVFEDNKARVQKFSPGQVVPFKAILPIAHEGPANVSIVKTATNKILGNMLLVFDSYADEKLKVLPANNTNFAVTIPTNLAASDCKLAGECVLQWFWFGTAAKQTYESCVDFVIVSASNSSVGAGSGTSTSIVSATSAAATSALASSTSAAAISTPSSVTATSSAIGGFSTTPSTSESSGNSSSDGSSSSSGSSSSESGSSGDGSSEQSSSDGSSSDDLASANEASIPIPEPAEPAEGAFGGTAGTIPELNADGTPAEDSFGGTQGSIAAVTRRLRRFIRPDDATSRK